jgi:hypothetical protein
MYERQQPPEIEIDPGKFDLEIEPRRRRWWLEPATWLLSHVRHQVAVLGITSIVAVIYLSQARAQALDTALVAVAVSWIAIIAITDILTAKRHDEGIKSERAVAPGRLSKDKGKVGRVAGANRGEQHDRGGPARSGAVRSRFRGDDKRARSRHPESDGEG